MRVTELFDDIERQCDIDNAIEVPSRYELLAILNAELNELSSVKNWSWAVTYLDPVISTVVGTKAYLLPESFGDNFLPGGGDDYDKYLCKLNDGSTEQCLEYKTQARFFSQDFESADNGRPSNYTIIVAPGGIRELWLYPAPDDEYTISGLYCKTYWKIDAMDSLPIIRPDSMILKYAILRRLLPQKYEGQYQTALARLLVNEAKSGRTQLFPINDVVRNRYAYD